uniref:Zinc finger, MYND-type containing 12 n=1 Tax=Cyprinodon variegatus TaxID=28743 RepID=A0A3Q2DU23_CYPVA
MASTSSILPLALPKGKKKFCELCHGEAYFQCSKCRVTFYCNVEHQLADWAGIHETICQLLVPIRAPTDIPNQAALRVELIRICRLEAQCKLLEGKHQEALPAAHCCLQTSIDVHGVSSIELVPAYLLLAEANAGLNNTAAVARHLSKAELTVVRSPEPGPFIQHWLHRSLGQFCMAAGKLEAALHHFANDIYYATEEYGFDSATTSKGYFLMAAVFFRQKKLTLVHYLYSKVAQSWHNHLSGLLKTYTNVLQNSAVSPYSSYEKSQLVEMEEMLRTMLEFQQKEFRKNAVQAALLTHCLAMLWLLRGDFQKALGFGSTALQASQQIAKHDLTESIQGLLQQVQSLQAEPRPASG